MNKKKKKKENHTNIKNLLWHDTKEREMRKLGIEPKIQSTEAGLLTTKVSQFPMQSEEKKEKKKEHAFFPFQTCSFANVFIRLNASTNTFITFYEYNQYQIVATPGHLKQVICRILIFIIGWVVKNCMILLDFYIKVCTCVPLFLKCDHFLSVQHFMTIKPIVSLIGFSLILHMWVHFERFRI